MKIIPAWCAWVFMVGFPLTNAFGGSRFVVSRPQQRHYSNYCGTGLQHPTAAAAAAAVQSEGDQRLTSIHSSSSSSGDYHQQPKPTVDNINHQQLVLREFAMPLQADPALYERRVRAECLRAGGETATVVRWHISRADEKAGQAHVEVRRPRWTGFASDYYGR